MSALLINNEVIMELEKVLKSMPDASIEEAINQSLEVLKKQNRFLLLARRELKRRRKEDKCEL